MSDAPVRTGKFERNQRLLRRRKSGLSQRALSREFKISQPRVRDILERYGDPLKPSRSDGELTELDIRDEIAELERRRAADGVRLRVLREELEVRRTDHLLGLG